MSNKPKSGFVRPDVDPGEEVSKFKHVLVMLVLLPASLSILNMSCIHPT